jgi:hypothetical protein
MAMLFQDEKNGCHPGWICAAQQPSAVQLYSSSVILTKAYEIGRRVGIQFSLG